MRFCFAQNLFEAGDFGGEDVAADGGEAIVTASRVAVVSEFRDARRFLDEAVVHQFFEIVVKRAGAEFVFALRLANDFLHDAVAMEVFGSEGEQDVELGGGERKEYM
jgi:hypothetical protein